MKGQEAGSTSVARGNAGQCRDTGLSQAPLARRGRVARGRREPGCLERDAFGPWSPWGRSWPHWPGANPLNFATAYARFPALEPVTT
jgi:hypothetical protein